MTEKTFIFNGTQYLICTPSISACGFVAIATIYKLLTGYDFDDSWARNLTNRNFIMPSLQAKIAIYNNSVANSGGTPSALIKNGGLNYLDIIKMANALGLCAELENYRGDPLSLLNSMCFYGENTAFICWVKTKEGVSHAVVVPHIEFHNEIIVLDDNGGIVSYNFPDYEFGTFIGVAVRIWSQN